MQRVCETGVGHLLLPVSHWNGLLKGGKVRILFDGESLRGGQNRYLRARGPRVRSSLALEELRH